MWLGNWKLSLFLLKCFREAVIMHKCFINFVVMDNASKLHVFRQINTFYGWKMTENGHFLCKITKKTVCESKIVYFWHIISLEAMVMHQCFINFVVIEDSSKLHVIRQINTFYGWKMTENGHFLWKITKKTVRKAKIVYFWHRISLEAMVMHKCFINCIVMKNASKLHVITTNRYFYGWKITENIVFWDRDAQNMEIRCQPPDFQNFWKNYNFIQLFMSICIQRAHNDFSICIQTEIRAIFVFWGP